MLHRSLAATSDEFLMSLGRPDSAQATEVNMTEASMTKQSLCIDFLEASMSGCLSVLHTIS